MDELARAIPPAGNDKEVVESQEPDQFPVGLRVLVVDDDMVSLMIVEKMLQRCRYTVTACSHAATALSLLRERKGAYDLVLSDVHMPDMDGYKLLELVGLEMDLPVIMMSADGRTSAVMKGIQHGACGYLIKPVRNAELRNIWQHVVRKKWIGKKNDEQSDSFDENDLNNRRGEDVEYASSGGTDGALKRKRSCSKEEDDDEQENDDSSAAKKPRVVWSVELHQQFVAAVNQLGMDKAVPKRILELMNVPGLTRENVASHLQKFRLYLKRLSGVSQHNGIQNPFCGVLESSPKLTSLGKLELQALAASGQFSSPSVSEFQAGGLFSPADQALILQSSINTPNGIPVEQNLSFGQPLVKSVEEGLTGYEAWPSSSLQNHAIMEMGFRNQQPNRSITVQPSRFVAPNQIYDRNSAIDNLAPQPFSSPATGSLSGPYSGRYSIPVASSSSVPSSSLNCEAAMFGQNSIPLRSSSNVWSCLVGRGNGSIPSRFALDELDYKVKQEPDLSLPMTYQFPSNDLTSFFTEN